MTELEEGGSCSCEWLPSDESSIEALEKEASSGNVGAEAILADASAAEVGNAQTLAQSRSLYLEAADSGVPSAYLGLARVSLLEDASSKGRRSGSLLLREASSRGSAEADRLLARLTAWGAKDAGDRAESWQLLVRAAQRGDAVACAEVSEACLSGSWNGYSVPVDEEAAVELLRIGVGQMSPRAALMLAMYLTRAGVDTAQEDYDESVELLYNALVWAHDAEPELIEEIEGLRDDGGLYIRTWLLARHLYEETINPTPVEDTDIVSGEIESKVWNGVRMTLKIEGAANGSMLSLLGFPYDAPYIWDGEVSMTEAGCLSVASEDPYWPSVQRLLETDDLPLYVKVLDGAMAGQVLYVDPDWVAGEDRLIILDDDGGIKLDGATRVAIGRWRTLFSVFGQYNEVGLRPGASANDADQIILFDPVDQQFDRYYFDSDLMAWVWSGAPDVAIDDFILPPSEVLFVLRREDAPLYITADGVISGAPSQVTLYSGLNLVANIEGKLFEGLETEAIANTSVGACRIPVYMVNEAGELTGTGHVQNGANWWKLMGISQNTTVYMNDLYAFVISTGSEAAFSATQK